MAEKGGKGVGSLKGVGRSENTPSSQSVRKEYGQMAKHRSPGVTKKLNEKNVKKTAHGGHGGQPQPKSWGNSQKTNDNAKRKKRQNVHPDQQISHKGEKEVHPEGTSCGGGEKRKAYCVTVWAFPRAE